MQLSLKEKKDSRKHHIESYAPIQISQKNFTISRFNFRKSLEGSINLINGERFTFSASKI